MRDIARAARVSLITVSRALNPATAHRVKASTRARIEREALARGYRVNQYARALRSGRARSLALLFPPSPHFAASEYYAQVVFSTVNAAYDVAYDVKVHVMRSKETTINDFDDMGVDGIILAGFSDGIRQVLAQAPTLPVVLLNSAHVPGRPAVDADNVHGGQLAAEHLLAFAHERFGVLAGPAYSPNARDRLRGFTETLARYGVSLPQEQVETCDFGVEEGRRAAQSLLKRAPHITALFCASDELAIGALQTARSLGLQCPADISIVGFDNISASALTLPPLTTIEQPIAEMCARCVTVLLELLGGGKPRQRHLMPVRLVTRASVAPPRPASS
ncbi:MAG: LacI family transcriptional regulator [bacterium]|nr:LacI family transcriptional regulator [bacterium]